MRVAGLTNALSQQHSFINVEINVFFFILHRWGLHLLEQSSKTGIKNKSVNCDSKRLPSLLKREQSKKLAL